MRWYKRLGALLLAAVLILGLCQIPKGEVEAGSKYSITNITLLDGKRTFTGDKGNIITLAEKDPIVVDTASDIITIYYTSISDFPTGDSTEWETYDLKNDVEITVKGFTENVSKRTFAIYTYPNKKVSGRIIAQEKPTKKASYLADTGNLVLKPESERSDGTKFDGNYPQITSFKVKDGVEIKGVLVKSTEVKSLKLTDEQLNEDVIDAGIINIVLQTPLKATDDVAQVTLSNAFYIAKIGRPESYVSAILDNTTLNWRPNTQATYLNINAKKADGTEQIFRYKVNLNIAACLYVSQDDFKSFLDIDGILGLTSNIESRVDNEAGGVMTIKTRKYLSGLSRLPVKPHYAAGAFMVPDSITGGTLNKDGSITPKNLNTGLRFTIQNAMGDQKPYSIQVVTPWALQWKDSDNSQIKNVLKDDVVQERTGAATHTVETLDAGSNVEVQLTAPKGKVLDKVVLKNGDGSTVDGVTYKNGSFSFVMPSDVVTIESISWKDGSYHNVSVSVKDTDGKKLDSQYCTATIKVGDVEDTVAAVNDTVTLTAKTEPHDYYKYQLDHWEYNAEVLKDAQADKEAGTLTFTMPDQEVAITPVYKKVGTQMTFGIKEPDGGSFRGFYGDGYYLQVDKTNPSYTDIYKPGARIQLSLTVNSTGYRFVGWTDGQGNTWGQDAANWSGNNATLTIGSTPQTWIAEFEAKQFASVTLKSENDQMGTVTGTYQDKEGTYFDTVFDGDEITLKAAPKKGYLFDKWEVAGAEVTMPEDAGAETTFTMPKTGQDLTITAVFKEDPDYKSDACEITNVELLDSDGKVVRAMTGKEGTTLTIALTKTDMSAEDAEGLAQEGKYYLRITHSDKATVFHRTFDDAHPSYPDLAWNKGNVTCPITVNSLGEEFVVTAEAPKYQKTYTIKITYESEKPVISDMTVERTSETEAKVTFTSDTKGNYSYLYKKANAEEPTQDEVLASALKGSIGAGSSQTINLKDLSNTAYKVYLVVKGNMNGAMPSDVVAIDVPKIGTYTVGNFCSESGGTVTVDKKRADAGEKITVTVTPKTGMKLDSLTYSTDLAGSAPVSILDKKVSEGVYVFDMPTANITIGCTWSKTSETEGPTITGFVINGTSGTISQSAGTIKITMPYGTDLTSLKPEITLQNAVSVSPASGTAVNLSSPVTYTVTAEDGTTKTYTVTATVAAQSTSDKLWEGMLDNVGGSTDHSGKNTWWEKAKDKKKHNNYPTYW